MIVFFPEASNEKVLPRYAKGWNSRGSVVPLTRIALASLTGCAFLTYSSSFFIRSLPVMGENKAQLELKNMLHVNCFTPL